MSVESLRRQQRADAARLLLALHAGGNLDNPQGWSWDAVDRLPAWCLVSEPERKQIQLICGALYLSPEIRLWIQKPLLQSVQQLVGESVFQRIIEHADAMQLPREPLVETIAESGIDLATADVEQMENLLMAAGATVLSASIHESLPGDMLLASLGQGIGQMNESAAAVLLEVASALRNDSSAAEVNAL